MPRFLSADTKFYDLFERGAAKVHEGATLLEELVRDVSGVLLKAKKLKEVEHEGDLITHETMERLHKTFVTPLDREDIHDLVTSLDDILDFIEATSERLALFKISQNTPDALVLVDILVRCVRETEKAISCLRNLNGPDLILRHCIEINRLENEGDFASRSAIARLFEESGDPLTVMKWKEIYENIENAIDRCEDVANVLEGIALKNA